MKYAFTNANLLDGRLNEVGSMPLRRNSTILIDGETITGVSTGAISDLTGYEIIDLNGKYLMPGLINMHVHFVPAMPVKKPKPGKEQKASKRR